MGFGICVRVKGPRAVFSRPEFHTERVSYDVMTPSAARGIIEAVYYKPELKWIIDSIEVLNRIEFDSIRRNEVGSKGNFSDFKKAYTVGGEPPAIAASDPSQRQQRNTLYLTDVDYVVKAHFELTGKGEPAVDTPEKHYNIALRRLRKGQCFNQPYLGCREFPAEVSLVEDADELPASYYADVEDKDLGFMLYDLDYENDMRPMFFRARMVHGVIDVAAARGRVMA